MTERCVFQLTASGLELTEIAAGIDLERDILSQMEFAPLSKKLSKGERERDQLFFFFSRPLKFWLEWMQEYFNPEVINHLTPKKTFLHSLVMGLKQHILQTMDKASKL